MHLLNSYHHHSFPLQMKSASWSSKFILHTPLQSVQQLTQSSLLIIIFLQKRYQFSSYSRLTTQTNAGGYNQGLPSQSFSNLDYANPTDPDASLFAQFETQTCDYHQTESGASYPGYDRYAKDLQLYYDSGVPIYYEYTNYSTFGPSHVYEVLVPSQETPPRMLTYTLAYESSTNYLRAYVINGTEYCCPNNGTLSVYCPSIYPSIYPSIHVSMSSN